jgi:trehalose 6-phosphate phosphatase
MTIDLGRLDPARTGLFLDFDGTLTPFNGPSEEITLADGLLDVLEELAGVLGVVAVVSGRPAPFLAVTFPLPKVRLAGVYGLEEWAHGAAIDAPGVGPWLPVLAQAYEMLEAEVASIPGTMLKNKRVSIVVHWSREADEAGAGAAIAQAAARVTAATGLRSQVGKLALELVPAVDVDKGHVVRRLAEEAQLGHIICIGDDVGDLAAFAVAHEHGGLAIAVDDEANGQPAHADVLAAADAVLAGPHAVVAWLEQLRGFAVRQAPDRGSSFAEGHRGAS